MDCVWTVYGLYMAVYGMYALCIGHYGSKWTVFALYMDQMAPRALYMDSMRCLWFYIRLHGLCIHCILTVWGLGACMWTVWAMHGLGMDVYGCV